MTGPRLGFLYPGYSAEDEYPRLGRMLRGSVDVELVHTHMGEDAHRIDALLAIGGKDTLLEGARELGERGVDACLWACTSGSFVFGWEGAVQQAADIEELLGVPSSSTSFAFTKALATLGVGQVAIAATYPEDVAEKFAEFLARAGVETVSVGSQGIITAAEVGTLSSQSVLRFVGAGDHPRAGAVLVPDTALHTVTLIDDLEERLAKPVLTANQVTMWEALRLTGSLEPQEGLGTLFRAGAQPDTASPRSGP